MSRFTSASNILHFLGSMSIDFILSERMELLMKQSFFSTGVVNMCSLVIANSDNFIDISMRYNFHSNMSGIDIKSGFKHEFSNIVVVKDLL